MLFSLTACKEDVVYVGDSDFESYPDYWNDFNNTDNIYVPQEPDDNLGEEDEAPDFSNDDTSNNIDSDGDGQPNYKDDDIDGDGIKNENDDDIDGDGTKNDQDDDIDGDGTGNEGDLTPDGPPKSDKNEGPFVPIIS